MLSHYGAPCKGIRASITRPRQPGVLQKVSSASGSSLRITNSVRGFPCVKSQRNIYALENDDATGKSNRSLGEKLSGTTRSRPVQERQLAVTGLATGRSR